MKTLKVLGLAGLIFLASSVFVTPHAMAQGPQVTFADLLSKLKAAGADIKLEKGIAEGKEVCVIQAVLKQTEPLTVGFSEAWLMKLLGLPINETSRVLLYDLGLGSNLNSGGKHYAKFTVDPKFCNPPSAPATNPVLEPSPSTNPSGTMNTIALALLGLAGIAAGLWIFPRLVGARVRI